MKIVLDGVTKQFPDRHNKKGIVTAVDNMTIEIPDGKMVSLLGPSGCGKSTALHLICGLEEPTNGRIYFGADDVTDVPPEKRGAGLVFQSYALYPHMTVRKNIMFPLGNLSGKNKLSKEEKEKRVLEAAKLVQIDSLLDRYPSELSGGQQQRVAIARSLVRLPVVLLLDEPLSNLDARLRLQTREELRRIQRETGITTVFVTHDQEEAMSISDLIIVMKNGVIQQVDEPQRVYDRPVNLFVAKFLGTPEINVFTGSVRNGRLFIGEEDVLPAKNIPDGSCTVGVRPEGFSVCADGELSASLSRIEVMGRDTTVIAENAFAEGIIRAIVPSGSVAVSEKIRFRLNPAKVIVFDNETGKALCGEAE